MWIVFRIWEHPIVKTVLVEHLFPDFGEGCLCAATPGIGQERARNRRAFYFVGDINFVIAVWSKGFQASVDCIEVEFSGILFDF